MRGCLYGQVRRLTSFAAIGIAGAYPRRELTSCQGTHTRGGQRPLPRKARTLTEQRSYHAVPTQLAGSVAAGARRRTCTVRVYGMGV